MRVATVFSRGLAGLEAPLVRVEAHVGGGLPQFRIVGLPDTEVKEARDRVRAALETSQFRFPDGRVTVNLAPADLPKESGRFDLPIAIGILAASQQVPDRELASLDCAGELGLAGELRPIRGALAMTFGAHRDGRAFVIPETAAAEASLAPRARVLAARAWAAPRCSPYISASPGRARNAGAISRMFAASTMRAARWRSRRPAGIRS